VERVGRGLAVLLAGAGGGAAVELIGARWVAAGLGALAALAALLAWWPGRAIAALLGPAALNRFVVLGGGASIKPEHIAAVGLAAVLVARLALAPPRPGGPRLRFGSGLALAGLALYLGANLLASLLNAPQPADSLRQVGLITLVAVPYGLALNLITDRVTLRQALLLWLALGVLEAMSGLGIMLLWRATGLDLGVQQVLGAPPVPVGTLREGNIFGSYCGAAAVGLLALLPTTRRRAYFLIGSAVLLIVLAGLAISLSRGAWVGFVAGAALVGLVRAGVLARRGAPVALLLAILVPLGVLLLAPLGRTPIQSDLLGRLASLDFGTLGQQQTVLERLDTYEKAWEGITAQPLLGNGTGSFGQRYVYRSVNEPGWVGNLELHLLYDSGLIGLARFALFTGVIGGRAARAYRRSRDPLLRGTLLALGGGLLSLLVAYQATEATWLAFTWVHFGLFAAATAVAAAAPGGLITGDPPAPPSHSEAIRQKKIINTPLLNLDSSSGK
jgi:O-antigen ligase